MTCLRIVDKDFNLVGDIDEYSSLQWTKRFNKSGEFELHTGLNTGILKKLSKDNIIFKINEPTQAAMLEHIEVSLNQNGQYEIIAKGRNLQSILDRRITIPPVGTDYDYINAEAETVLKSFVNNNAVNPVDMNRKMDNLDIALDKKRGIKIPYQTAHKNLLEEIENISNAVDIGFSINLDIKNKKFIFDVVEGRNLSMNQNVNSRVCFSTMFNNIETQEYIASSTDTKNMAYVGGQGEGKSRKIITVGKDLKGLKRRELFVDSRDIGESADTEANLTARGIQELSQFKEVISLDSKVINIKPFIYKKQWDLGDIVTVRNENLGLSIDVRIVEVREIYENNAVRIEVVFGSNIPTIIDKLKRM